MKILKQQLSFIDSFYNLSMIEPQMLINLLDDNMNVDSLEIMCHPGYLDSKILSSSSYAYPRVKELETLTNKEVIQFINEKNIELINFKDI